MILKYEIHTLLVKIIKTVKTLNNGKFENTEFVHYIEVHVIQEFSFERFYCTCL